MRRVLRSIARLVRANRRLEGSANFYFHSYPSISEKNRRWSEWTYALLKIHDSFDRLDIENHLRSFDFEDSLYRFVIRKYIRSTHSGQTQYVDAGNAKLYKSCLTDEELTALFRCQIRDENGAAPAKTTLEGNKSETASAMGPNRGSRFNAGIIRS